MELKEFKGTGLSVSKSLLGLKRTGFSSALQGKYRSFSNLSRSISSFASITSSRAMRSTKGLKLIFRRFQGQRWFCITNNLIRQYPIQESSLSITLQLIWPWIQTIKDLYPSPSKVREKRGVGRLIPLLDKNNSLHVSRKFQRTIEAEGMDKSNSGESNHWIFHRVLSSRFPNPLSGNQRASVVEHAHIPKPLAVSESHVISTRPLSKGVLSYARVLSAIPLSEIFNPITAKEIFRRQKLQSVENIPLSFAKLGQESFPRGDPRTKNTTSPEIEHAYPTKAMPIGESHIKEKIAERSTQMEPPSLNLQRVADQVYSILEMKMKVERERRGLYG